jgi:aconitase A
MPARRVGRTQARVQAHRGGGRLRLGISPLILRALKLRIDTPIEVDYYKHGGILPFVLRQLLAA